MVKPIATSIIFLISCLMVASTSADTVYIKAGKLLNPVNGEISNDALITIENERVVSTSGDYSEIPAGATVVDLSSHFVLPGLMDMHTHVVGHLDNYFFAGYFQSPHRATIGAVVNAEKTLMAGFTSIRNVGAGDFQDVALRDSIDAGEVPGPRMAVSGPSLNITGGHGDKNSLNHTFNERSDGVADGPWEVRTQEGPRSWG